MQYSHNGRFLLSTDDGGQVKYWKPNLELVKVAPGSARCTPIVSAAMVVSCYRCDPHGARLLSASLRLKA